MSENTNETGKTWKCTFTDENGKRLILKVFYDESITFDLVYVAISNDDLSFPANFFVRSDKTGLKFKTKYNWTGSETCVKAYGLEKQFDNNKVHKFDQVVCFGKGCFKFDEDKEVVLEIVLQQNTEFLLPFDSPTEASFDVELYKEPPQTYKIKQVGESSSENDLLVIIECCNKMILCFEKTKQLLLGLPLELPSACNVKIVVAVTSVKVIKPKNFCFSNTTACSKTIDFKTFLTKADVMTLFTLAMKFGSRLGQLNFHQIQYIYRNKSDTYFNNILTKYGGQMNPYLKNFGGEQGSVLNGRIKGLFFSTMIDKHTKLLPEYSYFGNIRLHISACCMFNPSYNLYFSDFYCHHKCHRTTLVLVPKSSYLNPFFQSYLLPLNIFENPYLIVSPNLDGSFMVLVNMDINVEIFYTEPINITYVLNNGLGFMANTATIGRGYALKSGIPKNPTCDVCNFVR